jgi:Protein of unknown function (DUF2892)
MGFAAFMSSAAGRALRVIVGLGLVIVGLVLAFQASTSILGIVLAVIGLVPLGAGIFDVCLFAPLFGAPLSGAKVRARA